MVIFNSEREIKQDPSEQPWTKPFFCGFYLTFTDRSAFILA